MSINRAHHQSSGVYGAAWFERYEQDLKKHDTVSIQSVYPYIFFKLAHDFAFSKENSIDIHDPVALSYFMGNFCYNQVTKDFRRSAIVMQSLTERMYFGSPCISRKRMRNFSRQTGKPVDDFETFITCLEEKVFQNRLSNFDESQKETLGMILRIINQGVSAVGIKMLNAYLQVRSGESDQLSSDSLNVIRYIMRPDMSFKKGSSQIDIVYDESGKIQLHRREYLKVQKLDMESVLELDETKDERWCLMMLLSREDTVGSSQWRLHFSVSHIGNNSENAKVNRFTKSQIKAREMGWVSNGMRSCDSDESTSSDGSPMSLDSLSNSAVKADNWKSDVRRKWRRRGRPVRDLQNWRKARQDRLVLTPSDSSEHSFSFCYPVANSRNRQTNRPPGKTDIIHRGSPERSSPDFVFVDIDEVKENKSAILPRSIRASEINDISGSSWI